MSRRSLLAAFVLVVALLPSARADAPTSRFSFKVPKGFVDRSRMETRAWAVVAFDEPHELVFQATVRPGAAPAATSEFLDVYADKAEASVKKRGGELKVLAKTVVTIDGVSAGRFLFEMPPPEGATERKTVRQLQFYVPATDQSAVLTFTAPAETYGKYEPLFDKTAQATKIRK